MGNREILFLDPVFKETLWGGTKLKEKMGLDIPGPKTGEAWVAGAHPNGDCTVREGRYKGKTLSFLWDNQKKLFGNMEGQQFPLLVKFIDARKDLSIQVHPDDKYARINEDGAKGKSECWYILDCDDDAQIVVGHNAKSHEELNEMIDQGRYDELINKIKVKKGDFIQIDPGTVHAICGGVMLLETQENSDITYRVYDYDRIYNGSKRELHVDKSKDVITAPSSEVKVKHTSTDGMSDSINMLIANSSYSVSKVTVNSVITLKNTSKFMIVSCVDGHGYADGRHLETGDTFLVPYGYGKFKLSGNMTLIISQP